MTGPERPERPEWAEYVNNALMEAVAWGTGGEDRLTAAEADLLIAISFRVRHRLGETALNGFSLAPLAEVTLKRGIDEINAETEESR
ncbi:hypothetical protein [Actinoallomurus sp. NPDC052274]|uniref:hypothetical protein n=1 Tax=Actinoallomurus sp. NPDC052274 TaxID=3155420 RepID=UPI0034455EC5